MKIAVLFPGYGNQYVGMAKDLYDEFRIVQEYFEEASNCLDINFVKLCFASSDTDLAQMHNAYTALFLVSCSLYSLLKEQGLQSDIFVGYNTGDYAALYAAGSITFPDGLYLLNKLAQQYESFLVQENVALLQIEGLSTLDVEKACKKYAKKNAPVSIAIYQADTIHVVGGSKDVVDQLKEDLCNNKSIVCSSVPLAVGLHSSLMGPVVEQFKMYLEKVDFKDIHTPCIGSQAELLNSGEMIKKYIVDSVQMPLHWHKIMDSLGGYSIIIEVGPGNQLSTLARAQYPDKIILSIQSKEDLEILSSYLSKHEDDSENI